MNVIQKNILQRVCPQFCQISCLSTPMILCTSEQGWLLQFHTNTSLNMFYFNVQRFSVYTYMQSNLVPVLLHPPMASQTVMDLILLVLGAE